MHMSNFLCNFAAQNDKCMKKSTKITLWVVGCLFAFCALVIGMMDAGLSYVAKKEIKQHLADMPEIDASVGNIHVLLFSGTVVVKDIHFATCAFAHKADTDEVPLAPGLRADIPTLSVGPISYIRLLKDKNFWTYNITIDKPRLTFYLDEKHPENSFPTFPKDTNMANADQFLKRIDINRIRLNKFCGQIKSTKTPLDVAVDSLSVTVNDLAYLLQEQQFLYNDSDYSVSLAAARVTIPDGTAALEAHNLKTKDQGPLTLGYTRFRNIKSIFALADKADEPTTWIDLEVNSVKTSPLNPIRKALKQDYTLASLTADVKRMHVKRDNRHNYKEPVPTPQQFLQQVPVPFTVQSVKANVRKIEIEMYLQKENPGKLQLQDIQASLANISNRKNAVWDCKAHAPVGEKGIVDAEFKLHMDKDSHFDLSLNGTDIQASFLNPFIRPLVGISLDCQINQIETAYSGDDKKATGTFCLLYNGLAIQAHKEDKVPFSVVTKHANTITTVANSLLTKSNPTVVDIKPRKYSVEWERDVMKDYPLYLFGPCIIGAVQTMLPGLYVHKQI